MFLNIPLQMKTKMFKLFKNLKSLRMQKPQRKEMFFEVFPLILFQ